MIFLAWIALADVSPATDAAMASAKTVQQYEADNALGHSCWQRHSWVYTARLWRHQEQEGATVLTLALMTATGGVRSMVSAEKGDSRQGCPGGGHTVDEWSADSHLI